MQGEQPQSWFRNLLASPIGRGALVGFILGWIVDTVLPPAPRRVDYGQPAVVRNTLPDRTTQVTAVPALAILLGLMGGMGGLVYSLRPWRKRDENLEARAADTEEPIWPPVRREASDSAAFTDLQTNGFRL